MKDDTELETFLPKTSLDSQTTVAANSPRGKTRTKVQFVTVDSDGWVKRADVVFVFDEDFTIIQAAEHAIAHFPNPESAPTFNEVYVFFQEGNGEKRIAITDVNVNVHSMFSNIDTMIVANDRKVFKIEENIEATGACCGSLCSIVFFFTLVGVLVYFNLHRS